MADLKINELDSVIGDMNSADLLLVKMKQRGSAVGDEDRSITWANLVTSLHLENYLLVTGGNVTGDVTFSNTKGVKSKTSGGSSVNIAYLDSSNNTQIGSTTQPAIINSNVVPVYKNQTGSYNFITQANLPVPGDINAYTKTEVNSLLAQKLSLTGGTLTGSLNLASGLAISFSSKQMLYYDSTAITFSVGSADTLHVLKSNANPQWTDGTNTYTFYSDNNKPTAADVGAPSLSTFNTAIALKANIASPTFTGTVTAPGITLTDSLLSNLGTSYRAKVSMDATDSYLNIAKVDSTGATVSATVQLPVSSDSIVYTTANKPTTADLGLTTTVALANTALQPGDYGLASEALTVTDANIGSADNLSGFFKQDGSTNSHFSAQGVGVQMLYGEDSGATATLSANLFVTSAGVAYAEWLSKDISSGTVTSTLNKLYGTLNKPTTTELGVYSKTESDARYARLGANNDITSLNALTGNIKVATDAVDDLELTTLRQVQTMTGGSTGSIIGITGGFLGAVNWFLGTRANIPAGFAAYDGQTVNRADYPELWSAINAGTVPSITDATWLATPAQRGLFSTGDGSTTFRFPDLNGIQTDSITELFLRGSATDTVGGILQNSAPNITGSSGQSYGQVSVGVDWQTNSGAFSAYDITSGRYRVTGTDSNTYSLARGFSFNASSSSAAYGRDTSGQVHPNQVKGIWIGRVNGLFVSSSTQFSVIKSIDSYVTGDNYGGAVLSNLQLNGNTTALMRMRAKVNYDGDSTYVAEPELSFVDNTGTTESYAWTLPKESGVLQNQDKRAIHGLDILVSTTSITLHAGSAYIPSLGMSLEVSSDITLAISSTTASTWYHIYLYDNDGTPAIEYSDIEPVDYAKPAKIKTGDNTRRYLGSFRVNASNVAMPQNSFSGKVVYRSELSSTTRVLSVGTATSLTSVSVGALVPTTAGTFNIYVTNSSTTTSVYISDSTGYSLLSVGYGLKNAFSDFNINTYPYIFYSNSATPSSGGAYIDIMGYTYER